MHDPPPPPPSHTHTYRRRQVDEEDPEDAPGFFSSIFGAGKAAPTRHISLKAPEDLGFQGMEEGAASSSSASNKDIEAAAAAAAAATGAAGAGGVGGVGGEEMEVPYAHADQMEGSAHRYAPSALHVGDADDAGAYGQGSGANGGAYGGAGAYGQGGGAYGGDDSSFAW